MKDLKNILVKAGETPAMLKIINPVLRRMIPFNRPHRLTVTELSSERAIVRIPHRKSNLNHLKGIHALALSTASEYASGLMILRHLGTKDFRLIMKSLKTDYHYQGKTAIDAVFELSEMDVQEKILSQLDEDGKTDFLCEIVTFDQNQNHISTTTCDWQIKKWDRVRTRI